MRKLLVFCILCFLIFTTSSCSKDAVLKNNNDPDASQPVITLDENNKVIYLDFTLADTGLLDKCVREDISTAEALHIIDQKTYEKFPEKVKSQLETIKWTWNHKGAVTAAVGIISYE